MTKEPPDAIHYNPCSEIPMRNVFLAICRVSQNKGKFFGVRTREGTRVYGKNGYKFVIQSIDTNPDKVFYLSEEEYFQYKLNGFFDNYEMVEE